jgi:hypothetical protein
MTHVKTSPYYPQSNGKIERWHGTLKRDCLRPHVPLSCDDARRLVGQFVEHYNRVRLHSALGYVAPADYLAGRAPAIYAARNRKLAEARQRRAVRRRESTSPAACEKGYRERLAGVQGAGNEAPGSPEPSTVNSTNNVRRGRNPTRSPDLSTR